MEWLAIAMCGTGGVGIARIFVFDVRRDAPLAAALALAFGLGLLTQGMFWYAVMRPGRLGPGTTLAMTVVLAVAGVLGGMYAGQPEAPPAPPGTRATSRSGAATVLALLAITGVTAIMANAAVWPFADGDALAVFGPLGRSIAAAGALPVGEGLYEAYSPHVPLLYAAIEWVRGGPDEQWSRAAAALYAIGSVAAAGGFARDVRSPRAGWLAAALLVSTPMFCRWASSGYADVPAAFHVLLSAWLAWRWWQKPKRRTAVAAGAAAGLALWTKNSTLTLCVTAMLLPLAWRWSGAGWRADRRVALADAAAGLAALVLVAAPWYIRNLALFGLVVPQTAWIGQANHSPTSLLVILRPEHGFGAMGWLMAALPVVWLAGRRSRGAATAAPCVLAAFVGTPFVLAWWWFASYDSRFLVTVVPLAASCGGGVLDDWISRWSISRRAWARAALAGLALALATSWAVAMRQAVEHKRLVLRAPWMDDLTRHRVRVGGLYEIGRAIDTLPPGTRVAGVPVMARYYLSPHRLTDVRWTGDRSAAASNAEFVVLRVGELPGHTGGPGQESPASCQEPPIVQTPDGYVLCRFVRRVGDERPPGAPGEHER